MRSARQQNLDNALLKSILPLVSTLQDWSSPIIFLGRISAVCYDHRQTKQKKPKCLKCGAAFQNYLLFVLHLQLIHKNELQVEKYQFSTDLLTIFIKDSNRETNQRRNNHLEVVRPKEYFLYLNYEDRIRDILMNIFGKFCKKYQKQKRQYFHSVDIFREISNNNEQTDSEDDVGHLQRELEKMRICDFSDVNEADKQFFIKWNCIVHETRKKYLILGHSQIMEMLIDFAKAAKRDQFKRLHVIMHGWTLWSSGKINAEEVKLFLKTFDQA